jgi:hypothetical protein
MPDQPPPPADAPVVIDAKPQPPTRGVESTAEVDIRDFIIPPPADDDPPTDPATGPSTGKPKKR